MSATGQPEQFRSANPHALAVILETSETKKIIASRDIYDISGMKLWARDRPVSRELQQRLADRSLQHPLESSLAAEDGVKPATLADEIKLLVISDSPLAPLLRPYATQLAQAASQFPLHSVAQLLLTATQTSRAMAFRHAVEAMALNGAITLASNGTLEQFRYAMISGLLHDIGEMYIDPRYGEADAESQLDLESYQQLVVHPHIGALLVKQLTDYPAAVARAISEHHEHLDGSGYPNRLQEQALSPTGRQLAVTEAALKALRTPGATLAHASVALRVVPGEFDLEWIGEISRAARQLPEMKAHLDEDSIRNRLGKLDAQLQLTLDRAQQLGSEAESPSLKDTLGMVEFLLRRLRTGWNESGLWSATALVGENAAEIEAVEDELTARLRAISRAARLRAGKLEDEDGERLQTICRELAGDAA